MTRPIATTDVTILQNVQREFESDTRVGETEVGIAVTQGLVMLSGTVSSYATKLAAQEIAHHVRGVLDVVNDIIVRVPGVGDPTDATIARSVRQSLECQPLIPHQQIRTTISNGWVQLEGEVANENLRDELENVVRRVAGVHGVTNRLINTDVSAQFADDPSLVAAAR